MKTIIYKEGTKEEKEYRLDLSFNAIVDTNAMEELDKANAIVQSMNNYNKLMAKVKPGGKVPAELENYDQTGKIREFLKILRSLLYICLQDEHSEEITDEKEAGKLVNKLCADKKYTIFSIFDVVTDCINDCDFLSDKTEQEPQEGTPKAE